jgi:NAD(P)-dependent dehydrogenase (short-subunit alcohol dehydrogenase family)
MSSIAPPRNHPSMRKALREKIMSILDSLRPTPDLRVLVTAGASGVGAAIACAFHEAGSRVHVCDIDRSALDRLSVDAPGITSSMADASIPADVDLVFDDVQGTLGGLDVLVNNAGIAGPSGAIETIDPHAWERTVAVNLNSHYYFARRAVPLLKQSRTSPRLIAMGSVGGGAGHALRAPYASTKWAIVGLVKSLAVELRPLGICVNAILQQPLEATPSRRPGAAGGVAALALFLCSPAARNLTGQAINVDRGGECFPE